MAGNVHILTSYGNDLMETVCKDACSGHDVGNVLTHSCASTLACNKGYRGLTEIF